MTSFFSALNAACRLFFRDWLRIYLPAGAFIALGVMAAIGMVPATSPAVFALPFAFIILMLPGVCSLQSDRAAPLAIFRDARKMLAPSAISAAVMFGLIQLVGRIWPGAELMNFAAAGIPKMLALGGLGWVALHLLGAWRAAAFRVQDKRPWSEGGLNMLVAPWRSVAARSPLIVAVFATASLAVGLVATAFQIAFSASGIGFLGPEIVAVIQVVILGPFAFAPGVALFFCLGDALRPDPENPDA
jgi:hypothetical protein